MLGIRRYWDIGDGLGDGRCTEIQGSQIWTEGWEGYFWVSPGSIDSHSISFYIILSYNEIHNGFFRSFDITHCIPYLWVHTIAWILNARSYYIFSQSAYASQARTDLPGKFCLNAARGAGEH
jgi:hypothetical protein